MSKTITGPMTATSENALLRFVADSPSAIAMFDKNMCYLAFSKRYVLENALSEESLTGQSHYDVFPDLPEKWKAAHQRCLAGATEYAEADSYLNEDKTEQWFEWEITPWYKTGTDIGGLILQRRDITLRKQNEQHLRAIFNQAAVGITRVAPDGSFLEVNRKLCEILGYSENELLQLTFQDVTYPDDLEIDLKLVQSVLDGERDAYTLEKRYLRKDGAVVWANLTASITRRQNGAPAFFISVVEDINARKNAEQALRHSEERYRSLMEATTSIIWTTDEDGGFTVPQPSWEKFTGVGWPEHRDFGWTKSIHPDDIDRIKQDWAKALDEKRLFTNEGRIWNQQRQEWRDYVVRSVPIINEDGSVREWVGLITDVTESQRLEHELLRTKELLKKTGEIARIGGWEYNLASKKLSWTEMTYKIHELPLDYVPDVDSALAYYQQDSRQKITAAFERLMQHGERFDLELEFTTAKNNLIWVRAIGEAVYEDSSIVSVAGTFEDITERKLAQTQLNYQASHDALTSLINRREFEKRVQRLLETVHSSGGEHALCFMDLDQFKVVNDTCGHTAGDEMLKQISSVLQNVSRKRDTLARLGGDEFGLLLEHCTLKQAIRVAEELREAVENFVFSWQGQIFKTGISVGLASITHETPNMTDLLKHADTACFIAKDSGRNRIHIYREEDEETAIRQGEMQWITRLHHALDNHDFCLYAQAIESIPENKIKHYELLLRMRGEKNELIPPGAFLPAAERYNLISKIDQWTIDCAFELLGSNPLFLEQIDFCSINLSGQSISNKDLLLHIMNRFLRNETLGRKICFEITETSAISNLTEAVEFIGQLKQFGCRFALDDFGSGLSSFAYLKNLPVDYLKIDGMFVRDIADDPIDHAMVKSINEIGQVMGMKTIAEFVESDIIKGMLKEIGVDYAQGYGISKPAPFASLLTDTTDNIIHFKEQN